MKIIEWIKKWQGIFSFQRRRIVVFVIYLILVFALFVGQYFNLEYTQMISDKPSMAETNVGYIYSDMELHQNFQLKGKGCLLTSIEILFATFNDTIATDGILFELYNDKDEKIFSKKISGEELSDNTYYEVSFPEKYRCSGMWYFTLRGQDARDTGTVSPTVWMSEYTGESQNLFINGEERGENINAAYHYETVGDTIFGFLFVQCIVCFFLAFLQLKPIKNKKAAMLMSLLLWGGNTIFIEWAVRQTGIAGVDMSVSIKVATYVLIFFLTVIMWGIGGDALMAIVVTDSFLILFSMVNFFVMKYRGVPVVPSDLFSLGTLSTVVSTYEISLTLFQLDMILWLLIIFGLGIRFRQWNFLIHLAGRVKKRKYVLLSIISVAIGILPVALLTNANVLKEVGTTTNMWDRNEGYYHNGPILNFMANLQYSYIKKPEGYQVERAKEILAEYEEDLQQSNPQRPNIIMIMNESLTDYTQWEDGGIVFDRDSLPFIHSLTDNTIKGKCYVSIFGSGTSNTELEALTGHSLAFFPKGSIVYQIFPQEKTKGIVSDLKEQNYNCTALHPFSKGNWNRPNVYQSMGFDAFLSQEDFQNPEMVRWISDRETYNKIIQLYENKETGSPMFVFDVTMQGHGGYNTWTNWETPVKVLGEDFPLANEYLSSTYVSDQAFSELIAYFDAQEEPTVICMFGDHQPSLEDSFYEKMMGKPLAGLTLAELQKRYVTPYLIWANYDIQEQSKDISANQLSDMIKEAANLPKSSYEEFIHSFSEQVPIINANGFQGEDGKWYEFGQTSPYDEWIKKYEILQYYIYCDWDK